MAIKNMQASVLARLKDQSKSSGIAFQIILQLFAQEEFLRRLSLSNYVENMILKGGMFIYTITEFESRPTRDTDFLIRNTHGDIDNVKRMMTEICGVSTGNDFITLEVLETKTISVEKKYPGVKTSFMGRIGKVTIPFSIDVGIDDLVVPEPIMRPIVTRLPDFEQPKVYTYSIESTIAEKFDAILQRMAGTSRMKDFYDIFYLSGIFDFDGSTLKEAVQSTLEHRGRILQSDTFVDIEEFKKDDALLTMWRAFEPAKMMQIPFEEVIDRLAVFLQPIFVSILEESDYNMHWSCGDARWS